MSRCAMAVLAGLSLALAFPCSPGAAATTTEEDVAAINQLRQMEAEGASSGDAEAALQPYAEDIVFMPPGEPGLHGRDAVKAWFEAMIEQFNVNLEYTSADTTVAGDWAFEHYAATATFAPKAGGDEVVEQVKGIHVFRRGADGSWRITHDIWNTDTPPPAME